MPANLTPEYLAAERRYRLARTIDEKLEILHEMLSVMPKHKGTERLQAEIKSRIARLKKEAKQKPVRRAPSYYISKEGAGQVVLVGPPNTGKSLLLAALTQATPEVAPYPFTTHAPIVGMMEYEDVKVQVIDTPPLTAHAPPWLIDLLRRADLLALVLRMGNQSLRDEIFELKELLKGFQLELVPEPCRGDWFRKQGLVIANQVDAPGMKLDLGIGLIRDAYPKLEAILISARTGQGILELKAKIFKSLDIIRVYTKEPGRPADLSEPVILPRGSSLLEAARAIHKDFAKNLKYARLWGGEYSGQRVERNHLLADGDLVEFHL
jgi:hypothetical protein